MEGWTLIFTCMFPQEAYMVKAYLESEEIIVVIQDSLTIQVHNFYSNAVGGVKLFVPNEQVELALDLLKKGAYIE